ncbi:MAG: DUF4968 domain-containing protein [Solobacterium sp.]|nr:DUF4968 domain-containing protein [Solobacterium sp.]
MKALLYCMLLLFAQEPVLQDMRVIHVQTGGDADIAGMRFTACIDEEGNAVQNENGDPVVLTVNADGDIVTDLQELQWVRVDSPPAGFYRDDTVYAVTGDTVTVAPAAIHIRLPEADVKLQFRDEEGTLQDPFVPEAGRTYTVHTETGEDMVFYEDVQLTVPLYAPDEEPEVRLSAKEYGRLQIRCTGEDGLPEKAVFRLYTDSGCTEMALDIHGEKAVLKPDADGNAEADLYEGEYYVRCSVKDDAFLTEDTLYKVSVMNRQVTEKEQVFLRRKIRITVTDGQGILEGCTPVLQDADGKQLEMQGENGVFEVFAPKGRYTASLQDVPQGYYEPAPVRISNAKSAVKDAGIICAPILIRVISADSVTKEPVQGGVLQAGGAEWDASGDDEVHLSCSAGDTVTVAAVQPEDHYVCREDPAVRIPRLAPEKMITVKRELTPFSDLIIRMPAPGMEVRLFMDEGLAEEAADIAGDPAAGISGSDGTVCLRMGDGTYYIVPASSSSVIPDAPVRRITVCHAESSSYEAVFEDVSVSLYIDAADETDGSPLSGIGMELLDEYGNTAAAWTADGEKTLFILRQGAPYTLRITGMPPFYTGQREMNFAAASDITVFLKPYSLLRLQGEDTGSEYALYEDEECTVPARDIAGKELTGLAPGAEVTLFDGEYRLKQVKSSPYRYPDRKVRKITVSMRKQPENTVKIREKELGLQISYPDEEGKEAEGITADILLDGKVIASGVQAGLFTSEKLKKGNTYTVKPAAVPYCRITEKEIWVKAGAKEAQNCAVFHIQRCGRLLFSVPEEAQVKGTFYADAACTEKAPDADGEDMVLVPAQTEYVFDVLPGEYWFSEEECAAGWYPQNRPQKIVCPPGRDTEAVLEKQRMEVTVSHVLGDSCVQGVEAQIEDPGGNILESWTSTGSPHDLSAAGLVPGETYVIRQTGSDGYVPKTEEIRFTVPKEAEGPLDVKVMETEKAAHGFPAKFFGSLSLSAAVCFLVKMRLKAHI